MRALAFGLLAVCLPLSALAQARGFPRPLEPRLPPGADWQAQVVRATGLGAPDVKGANAAQVRTGAERSALLDARRRLLAELKGLKLGPGRTVGEALETEEQRARLERLVQGCQVTARRVYSDMGMEVDVEVPLGAVLALFGAVDAGHR